MVTFADTRNFDEFNGGLIARRTDMVIPSDAGAVVWDMARFGFVDQVAIFDAVQPSMHHIAQAPDPDLTITLNRPELERIMMGATAFEALIASGAVVVTGDVSILGTLAGLMVRFDPLFDVMPATSMAAMDTPSDTLKADFGTIIPE